jgi:membrane-associated phospholipid phosphatase
MRWSPPVALDASLAAADWAGRHALPLFLIVLGVLLVIVGAVGWLWQVHVWPRARDGLPQPALLLLGVAAGFAVLVAAAALFADIAERLGDGARMSLLDAALSRSIGEHVDRSTLQVFAVLTHLGDAALLIGLALAVAALLWRRGRGALALAWLLALGGNALLIPLLKRIFERMRPAHEHGLVSEMGFSFPSGHTAGATVAYGMLAYLALRVLPGRWHVPAVLAATALAFTIGSSRVFLQVHFASDVLAGFAWGLAWLAVCVLSVELSRRYRLR